MVVKPTFGTGNAIDTINSLDKYLLVSMEAPWNLLEPSLSSQPSEMVFNANLDINQLEQLASIFEGFIKEGDSIVGIGGGSACDTAKFFSWYFKDHFQLDLDLYLIPSIISVDAFLCSSIAVRIDNKVNYIGDSKPKEIIIDYELIQKAPKFLNRAGVSDTISITSALGDWKLERQEAGGKFNQGIFDRARIIAEELMSHREDIREVTEKGIKAMVDGFYNEVVLCEEWGNARPEEGSEHFLAYCLEAITGDHYIHGNLIGMNILISIFLQGANSEFSLEEMEQFFKDIEIDISPEKQQIDYEDIATALKMIIDYVINEQLQYSIYNSPSLKLDDIRINKVINKLKDI